jgi:hypothetical protein
MSYEGIEQVAFFLPKTVCRMVLTQFMGLTVVIYIYCSGAYSTGLGVS